MKRYKASSRQWQQNLHNWVGQHHTNIHKVNEHLWAIHTPPNYKPATIHSEHGRNPEDGASSPDAEDSLSEFALPNVHPLHPLQHFHSPSPNSPIASTSTFHPTFSKFLLPSQEGWKAPHMPSLRMTNLLQFFPRSPGGHRHPSKQRHDTYSSQDNKWVVVAR